LLEDAKENVAEGFDKAKDTAENAGEFVKDKVDDVTGFVKDKAAEVRDRFDGDDEPATPPAATPPAP
jgi:hypothetical protein